MSVGAFKETRSENFTSAGEKSEFNPDKRLDVNDAKNEKAESSYNPDKRIEAKSESGEEKLGGSYRDVFTPGEGSEKEVHHIPAESSYPPDFEGLSDFRDMPAIKMDKCDHRQTASYGNSKEARAYCAEQKELINQGNFREALKMDINDIQGKFGDKYDNAIDQMNAYVDNLELEGKI